jgi:ribosomal protein S18 acetylase RimI-like enzyme
VFTFRTATPEDIPALLGFWQTAAENAARPQDSAAAVENLLARDPAALILAIDPSARSDPSDPSDPSDQRIVGSVIAGFDGWRCHLYRLAVAPDRRRQGIATTLVEHAEARFRALGGTRSDAMVLDDNVSAQSAWWAQGYRVQEEWSRWVRPLSGGVHPPR